MSIRVGKNNNSLQETILEARKLKSDAKRIIVEEGDYFFNSAIKIEPEDSGLTIEAEGRVRFFGGREIKNWQRRDGKLWTAQVPEVQSGHWDFRMLMVNGRFADRARYPETDYLIHETDFDVTWMSTYEGGFERQPTPEELTTLKYKPEDIPDTFESRNAEITVFHMWDESLVGVKSIERANSTITFSNPSGWPPGAFSKAYNFEKRYIIWNTIEGMLKPGQWYLDRNMGEVVYWPLDEEDMESMQAIAPVLESLVVIEGSEQNSVKDISLKGFSVSATNAPLMSGAFGAKLFDGAISIRYGDECTLTDLDVCNVGAHCIKASGDNLRIENCQLHNSGAGAIRYVGSETLIRNNHIHNVGKTFPSAIALYVGATDPNVPEEWEPGQNYQNCTIEHNEIHNVPYAAICAGGKNLRIMKNLIYEAMQDLYDGAGIYVTFCENAVIKNNFIRDIKNAPGAGTSAYYLDEKTVNALVEENLEINVPRPSHNHISSNNIFRNNFFIIKGKGWFSMERSEGYTFEKNVVVADEGFEIYDLKFCPTLRNNTFFTPNGKLITKDLDKYTILKEYELTLSNRNINSDPQIVEYKEGKVQLSPDSPALKMGIKPIDVSDAGLLVKE